MQQSSSYAELISKEIQGELWHSWNGSATLDRLFGRGLVLDDGVTDNKDLLDERP